MGRSRDADVDILCASVQTLARAEHLEKFSPQHFDYIVVDEFHHASATTYRRLLAYFAPSFLLGLTATPDRTDQSDILSLCDDNLVYSCHLFDGITAGLLSPFHYYGILDESVDYREVPWRNGRFDPEILSNKLATVGRARHVLRQWRQRSQRRTLAFCASIKHAEFMVQQFVREGIACAAVFVGSSLGRAQALEQLSSGKLMVLFTVDLFNEGIDLPSIDTVMMLRPTESKILFLQ
jgi:superfamily II DNA or RNA helicase